MSRKQDLLLLMMKTNSRAPGLLNRVTAAAQDNAAIRVITSDFFAVDEFQYYLNAADVGVLPFKEVMTSGTAIQALGFGLPLVLPQHGSMNDLIDETMGVLYDSNHKGALAAAMSRG